MQLFGSGPILRESLRAAEILAEKYGVGSDVWSVTSYNQLRRDAQECERWNMLNPDKTPRRSYVQQQLDGIEGPVIAATDYLRILAEQISPWVPGGLTSLGTDGMGRSESPRSSATSLRSGCRVHYARYAKPVGQARKI